MDADLDILATALYVKPDELLKAASQPAPWRPRWGSRPSSATPNWSPWRSCKPWSAPPRSLGASGLVLGPDLQPLAVEPKAMAGVLVMTAPPGGGQLRLPL
jgi:hypothetical protein